MTVDRIAWLESEKNYVEYEANLRDMIREEQDLLRERSNILTLSQKERERQRAWKEYNQKQRIYILRNSRYLTTK